MKRSSEALAPVRKSSPLSVWFVRHVSTCVGALGRLARQPFASLLTILVIAVTLALPAAMHLLVKNARALSGNWDNALDFSVYLQGDIDEQQAETLLNIVRQRADVESVTLVTKEQALAEFRDASGFGPAIDQLGRNPLPHTLIVRPSPSNTAMSMTLLQEELANLPETDFVQVDTEWVQRFHAILEIVQRAIGMGAGLLGAAIIVIIGNTIRLDIENRREEIEVTKLIGASNGFVRRPFLYSGLWYGLGGGLLALGLLAGGLHALEAPVSRLAGLYESSFAALSLDLRESLAIVGAGVFLGLTGS